MTVALNLNDRDRFRDACIEGLDARYSSVPPAAAERLAHELDVFEEHRLRPGLAIAAEVVADAKAEGILVGPGHGAAASSLACYALGITDIDPLANSLFFERFFNPLRADTAHVGLMVQDDRVGEAGDCVASHISVDLLGSVESAGQFESSDGVRQWNVGSVELSLVGSEVLSTIAHTTTLLRDRGIELDARGLPGDDAATFELLAGGNTDGVFEDDTQGIGRALREFEPTTLTDLSVVGALFWPGGYELAPSNGLRQAFADEKPKDSGAVDALLARFRPQGFDRLVDIIEARHTGHSSRYGVPLDAAVAATAGTVVFQEQVIELAVMRGLSPEEGDALRYAAGRHDRAPLKHAEQQWRAGPASREVDAYAAGRAWGDILCAADWMMCKAHALAHARVRYEAAYLKANHPEEFAAAAFAT